MLAKDRNAGYNVGDWEVIIMEELYAVYLESLDQDLRVFEK